MTQNNEQFSEITDRPGLVQRIKGHFGRITIKNDLIPHVRPPVDKFIPKANNIHGLSDYARRNACAANIQLEGESAYGRIMTQVGQLESAYGKCLAVGSLKYDWSMPNKNEYGFSAERPRTIFQHNMSTETCANSSDLLYIMGAEPSGAQVQIDSDNDTSRVRQEYASSTGLVFVDVRDSVINIEPGSNYHELYVYLPVSE